MPILLLLLLGGAAVAVIASSGKSSGGGVPGGAGGKSSGGGVPGGAGLSGTSTNISPQETAAIRGRVMKYWTTYRNSLASQFGAGAVAEGVDNYAAAIDSGLATTQALAATRESNSAAFKSAISATFGKQYGEWYDSIRKFVDSLGTPGGYSWEPARLEEAKNCVVETVKEGFPVIAFSVNMLGGDHMAFQGVREQYCGALEAMRRLPKPQQDALKTIWGMAIKNSKQKDVAFLLRYGLNAFVRDDYSDQAHDAYASYGPAWMTDPNWAMWATAVATIAAVGRGRPVTPEIDRVLSHLNDYTSNGGPGGTKTVSDVWSELAYLTQVALA